MTIAITGANGNLGKKLIRELGQEVRALVRSEQAKAGLLSEHPDLDVRIVNYTNSHELAQALVGCEQIVHLVGIIKETPSNTYFNAHEASCEALAVALPPEARSIVYLSIVGGHVDSSNTCLASKGRAEAILLGAEDGVSVTILQVPMVLGEGDYASFALARNARKSLAFAFRAESMEQPIYAGDVVQAVRASTEQNGKQTLCLGGPTVLTRAELIQRAAKLLNNSVRVISLPISLGYFIASICERLANPPITRAMLGVLDHDDEIDSNEALNALSLTLTPLDTMLEKILN